MQTFMDWLKATVTEVVVKDTVRVVGCEATVIFDSRVDDVFLRFFSFFLMVARVH